MKRKYKWILIAIIACISCGAYASVLMKPIEAEAETVSGGTLKRRFTAQGIILPETELILNSPSAGEVKALPCRAGSSVKAGALLLETGDASQMDLDLQREQYRQQLAEARQQYNRLFGPQGSAKARYDAAKSSYELADKNYNNAKILFDSGGYVSQTELDTMKTERELAYQDFLMAREDNSESAKTYYLSRIESCEKQLKTLEETVRPGSIIMPFDGVLWEYYVEAGAYLGPNQPAVKIYAPGRMKLEASVLSEDALLVRPGDRALVKYADGSREEAEVSFVSQVAVGKMSSVGIEENRCVIELKIYALPENAGAGQQADVEFTTVVLNDVLTVPSSAIVSGETGSMVYCIEKGKASARAVVTGKKSGGRIELISGVGEGEVIISDPYNAKIKQGSRVNALAKP